MNLIKSSYRRVKGLFSGSVSAHIEPVSGFEYKRTTTASRREERLANTKYAHVSIPIEKVPDEMVPFFGKYIRASYKGITRRNGNNLLKASADSLATDLGMNNKQRCKLRTSMKRRAAELRAQSVA